MIMQRPVNDIDLAVDLVDGGIRFARWLSRKGHTIGRPVIFARYGTAMVHLRRFGGAQVEIVQTRKAKYTPDIADTPEVAFGTVEEDARRRDLTINSLYLDLSNFRIVDYCNGCNDIKNKLLRTPMDADEIFIDDPVRALRVIRFATVLGWKIEPDVLPAIKRRADLLSTIKVERIANEFEKMMASSNPGLGLQLLLDNDMLPYVLPGLEKLSHRQFAFIKNTVDNKTLTNPATRLASIFIFMSLACKGDISALEIGQRLMHRLHMSSDIRHKVDFFTRFWQSTEHWGARLENLKPRLLRGFMRMCKDEETLMLMLNLIDNVHKRTRSGDIRGQIDLIKQRIANEDLISSVYYLKEKPVEQQAPKNKKKNKSSAKRRREQRRSAKQNNTNITE